MPSMDEAKIFKCGNGHALGLAVRNADGAVDLLLYRYALTPDPSPINGGGETDVDVIAMIQGYAVDIRCSICGRARMWVPGEEAMRQLLGRINHRDAEITEKSRG